MTGSGILVGPSLMHPGVRMDNELWRWVWVVTAMVMGLGEIFTAGFFLLPFALGAALAAAAAWLDLHGAVQWLLFFGGTAVSMLVLRRFMGRQDSPDALPVGANRYIGMHARAVEVIDVVNNTGRVRVESEEWRAVCEAGRIEEGSLVRVVALVGTKLKVEQLEPPSPDYKPSGSLSSGSAPAAPDSSDAGNPDATAPAAPDSQVPETGEETDETAETPASESAKTPASGTAMRRSD